MKIGLNSTLKISLLTIGMILSSLLISGFTVDNRVDGHKGFLQSKDTNSLTWSASNFIKLNKDKSIVILNGNAKFECKGFIILADEVIFYKKTQKVAAKNYSFKSKLIDSVSIGKYGEFAIK